MAEKSSVNPEYAELPTKLLEFIDEVSLYRYRSKSNLVSDPDSSQTRIILVEVVTLNVM